MQGSLENPPVIVNVARKKALVGFFAALIFGILIWEVTHRLSVGLALAGLAAIICGLPLITRAKLVVSPDGFTWMMGLGKASQPWSDFEEFYADQRLGFELLACRYDWTYPGGHEGIFFGIWELPMRDLVPLLNEARKRWSRPPLPAPPTSVNMPE